MTGRMFGTGIHQEVTPRRQEVAMDALERDRAYHEKAGTHLWIVVVVHRASDGLLDGVDDPDRADLRLIDADTMAGPPAVACFICEQAYEPRLRRRRCPGESS